MEYLRDFNYGRVSQLSDGTTLREFTIIVNDDEIMEGCHISSNYHHIEHDKSRL